MARAAGGIGPEETLIADTVRSHPRPGSNSDGNLAVVTHALTSEGHDASEDGTGRGTPLVPVAAPLFHGSNPNSNMAGRRREDDVNLVSVTPPGYNAWDADPAQAHAVEVLRRLREEVGAEAFEEWAAGVIAPLRSSPVLRSCLHGDGLQGEAQALRQGEDGAGSREQTGVAWAMRAVWEAERLGRTSPRRQSVEQLARELGAHLSQLPHPRASATALLHGLWGASEGLGLLREALSAIQEVGRSVGVQAESAHTADSSARLVEGGSGCAVRRLTPT